MNFRRDPFLLFRLRGRTQEQVLQAMEAFPVAIRPPVIETPLLKRLGEPAFVPAPGLQSLLRAAFQVIGRAAQEVAYADTSPQAQDE